MNYKIIHEKAKYLAAEYKRSEQELVAIIAQVDTCKAFYKLGYSSLFSYMTTALGLSEAVTCNISAVVRKAYQVPKLQEKVLSGKISLSKARKLTSVINIENQDRWLKIAETKTQRQIEREVSLANPKVAIAERVQYIPADNEIQERVQIKRRVPRLKLELGLAENLMLRLRRCQDLESQKQKRNVNLEGCLEALVQFYLYKQDPIRKAQRQIAKGNLRTPKAENNNALASVSDRPSAKTKRATVNTTPPPDLKLNPVYSKRLAIPARVRHQLQLRDEGRCSHQDNKGRRCASQRYLEIHHITPVHAGGNNQLENLKLLCHGHHKVEHCRK